MKTEKSLTLFTTDTNIFTLLFKELKTDGKSLPFAVWRNVKLNLSIIFMWTAEVQIWHIGKVHYCSVDYLISLLYG